MSSIQIRRFIRNDRDQTTALVNAHIAAVMPNISISVQELLSQLENEPREYIVDPWVDERITLVAEQKNRIVAAAHLLRYRDDEVVSDSYRDAGEIRWLVFWPNEQEAGEALAKTAVAQLKRWNVKQGYADGALPVPGVYGIPEQWPHIREVYQRVGFKNPGRIETIWVARVDTAAPATQAPLTGLTVQRSLGKIGTKFAAMLNGTEIGYVEVDTNLGSSSRMPRQTGWADIANLYVDEAYRRQSIGTWLMKQAFEWLQLGGVDRVIFYTTPDETDQIALLSKLGFQVASNTMRGLTLS